MSAPPRPRALSRLPRGPSGPAKVAWVGAALLVASGFPASAHPASAHTADEVQALVERAAEHIQAVGRRQAFDDITRPDGGFVDGDLYVFCASVDGVSLAHGGNPKLVGKSLLGIRDSDGVLTSVAIIRKSQTEGHGWVQYRWPNPKTGRVERKNTYVLRIDDGTVCASGYYMSDQP